MKTLILLMLFIVSTTNATAGDYVVDKYGPYKMTQVDRYLDGDSFEGWVSNYIYQTTFVRVRIRGIDAPEKRGSDACEKVLAEKSRLYLISLIDNSKFVILDNLKYDSFGRVLATVTVEKGDVATLMIKASMAHPYKLRSLIWCTSG